MEYDVVYELSSSGLGNLSFAAAGIPFIVLGALLIKFRNRLGKNRSHWSKTVFPWLFFFFAVVWTLSVGVGIGTQQASLRSDYEEGNFQVVEGVVENFHPMPEAGHEMESFSVNGVRFEYSDYVVTPGFNNTVSHGGPISAGLPVRVTYIGETIVKLEVVKTAR